MPNRPDLTIKFAQRTGEAFPFATRFLTAGKVDMRSIVTHHVGLEEAPGVFAALADNRPGYGKGSSTRRGPEPTNTTLSP